MTKAKKQPKGVFSEKEWIKFLHDFKKMALAVTRLRNETNSDTKDIIAKFLIREIQRLHDRLERYVKHRKKCC